MIGEGREAQDKTKRLRQAGAKVRLVTLAQFKLTQIPRQFFVIFCPKDEPALVKKVAAACRRRRVLLCAIDQPKYCDVVNVSSYDRGLLRITAATQGAAPAISRKIREGLEASLQDVPIEQYLEKLATLRVRLKKEIKNPEERIGKLIKATEGFAFRAKVKLPRNWAQQGRKRNS